jgi:hypothetical protein
LGKGKYLKSCHRILHGLIPFKIEGFQPKKLKHLDLFIIQKKFEENTNEAFSDDYFIFKQFVGGEGGFKL